MCRKSRDEFVLEERTAARVRDKHERWLTYSNKVKPSFLGKQSPGDVLLLLLPLPQVWNRFADVKDGRTMYIWPLRRCANEPLALSVEPPLA